MEGRAAAIYIRVSTDMQEERGESLDSQLAICQTEAARRGWTVPAEHIYRDVASAKSTDRVALQRLLSAIGRGELHAVLFVNWDRISRDALDGATLHRLFEKRGVSPICVLEPLDTGTPTGEVMFHLKLALAQYERRMTSQRVTSTLKQMVEDGKWVGGRPPFGYRKDGRILVVDPVAAALVIRMMRAYDEGESIIQIVRTLNDEALPSPGGRQWQPKTVRDVINHPCHQGEQRFSHWIGRWPFEVIPPQDLAHRVRERLRQRSHRRGPNRTRYSWYGTCYCGLCLQTVTFDASRKNGRRYIYLRCTDRTRERYAPALREKCSAPMVGMDKLDKLEAAFLEVCAASQPVPRRWEPAEDVIERLREIEERKLRERNIYRQGVSTHAEFEAAIRACDAAIAALQPPPMPMDVARAESFKDAWPNLSMGDRNRALRQMVRAVLIYPDHLLCVFADVGWDRWPAGIHFDRATENWWTMDAVPVVGR